MLCTLESIAVTVPYHGTLWIVSEVSRGAVSATGFWNLQCARRSNLNSMTHGQILGFVLQQSGALDLLLMILPELSMRADRDWHSLTYSGVPWLPSHLYYTLGKRRWPKSMKIVAQAMILMSPLFCLSEGLPNYPGPEITACSHLHNLDRRGQNTEANTRVGIQDPQNV